jgi:hypothetical protein
LERPQPVEWALCYSLLCLTDHSYQRPLLQIRLENFLSFGPAATPLELENLNILIGPNAAGKSNLIEALALMRATPVSPAASNMDLRGVVRRGGGVHEWIWKGGKSAILDVVVSNPRGEHPLRHVLSFGGDGQGFRLEDERIENQSPDRGENGPIFYYRFEHGQPLLFTQSSKDKLPLMWLRISQLVQIPLAVGRMGIAILWAGNSFFMQASNLMFSQAWTGGLPRISNTLGLCITGPAPQRTRAPSPRRSVRIMSLLTCF